MKTLAKLLLASLVLVLLSVGASANSYDPGIIIKDPVVCNPPNCTVITGNSWSFTVTKLATYNVSFLNSSGANWTGFTFTETGVAALSIPMIVRNFPPPGDTPRDWYAPVISW